MTHGFELVTHGFELVTCRFEVVTRVLLFHTFLVANNTFSNNLKYPHARKSHNNLGSINDFFMEMVFPLRFCYIFSKIHENFNYS